MGRPPKSDVDLAPFGVNLRAAIERSPHFRNRAGFLRHHATEGATLYRYEKGERPPPLDLVQSFAESLGVSVSDLVGDVQLETDQQSRHATVIDAFAAARARIGRPLEATTLAQLRRDLHAWDGVVTEADLVRLLPISEDRAHRKPEPPPVPRGMLRVVKKPAR